MVRLHLPHLPLHRPHPSTPSNSNTELTSNLDNNSTLQAPRQERPRNIHLLTHPRNKAITHLTHLLRLSMGISSNLHLLVARTRLRSSSDGSKVVRSMLLNLRKNDVLLGRPLRVVIRSRYHL